MPKTKQHLYEGMYILSATLSEEGRKKALGKIVAGIQYHSGEVHKTFEQGRRKLAYEIDGRKEGFYYILYFQASSSSMSEMWREYRLNEDLIRFMTQRVELVPEKIEFKKIEQAI